MPYVRNAWYVASWAADVAPELPSAIAILGEPIVLWRSGNGIVALEDRCVHRMAPLSLGRCEGGNLRCMYHGLLFDNAGTVIEIPGQEIIPPTARVRTYPAIERHSWIWVWMGDPARADPSLIPPAVGLDDPDYILGHGQLDYAAEARLINDNLLDFSHLTYVHANSFGAGSVFADERPNLVPLPNGVRFSRWVRNSPGPVGRKSDATLDGYMTYDFLIPGVLIMWNGSFAPGTADRVGQDRPDFADAVTGVTMTSQAVLPTSERTARYFFSWGPHRNHGDEALRDLLMGIGRQAFAEDKTMIEAQQRVIDNTANPKVMPTAHDKGVTLFNRLVEKLVSAEAADALQAGS